MFVLKCFGAKGEEGSVRKTLHNSTNTFEPIESFIVYSNNLASVRWNAKKTPIKLYRIQFLNPSDPIRRSQNVFLFSFHNWKLFIKVVNQIKLFSMILLAEKILVCIQYTNQIANQKKRKNVNSLYFTYRVFNIIQNDY